MTGNNSTEEGITQLAQDLADSTVFDGLVQDQLHELIRGHDYDSTEIDNEASRMLSDTAVRGINRELASLSNREGEANDLPAILFEVKLNGSGLSIDAYHINENGHSIELDGTWKTAGEMCTVSCDENKEPPFALKGTSDEPVVVFTLRLGSEELAEYASPAEN